ncbi:alpha/beta fold hydrolase [Nonomuraea sp. NPDC049152]|uniref:alpha/beta fold hydrolase n=1 Tax=Nonomuraea sp. NPDC049152 TaxID=3154350 RepID=UPI0033F9CB96
MTDVTLARGGATLRGTATGTGPTVLLLHAGGERRGVWTPVAAALTLCGLRTVAFDLRGHGDSSGRATTLRAISDDVTAMICREPAPVVVVGASLGGLAAIASLADPRAVRHVAGLVLVDVVPDPDPARVRAWLDDRGLLHDRTELVEDILGRGPELLATATKIELPILLVRGGPRSPLTDAEVERLRAANPAVTVSRVPAAGHLVARDAPDELARIVADQASTWLATETTARRAFALQRSLGADRLDHPGGTLLAHLHRVHALTVEWSATPRTQLAAICHATYGTDGFPHALMATTERRRLEGIIGPDAESLVYLYGACDRSNTYRNLGRQPLPAHDRFTGDLTPIHEADLVDFAVLTIANELDVARFARLPGTALNEIRRLVAALAAYAPVEAARALDDGALA